MKIQQFSQFVRKAVATLVGVGALYFISFVDVHAEGSMVYHCTISVAIKDTAVCPIDLFSHDKVNQISVSGNTPPIGKFSAGGTAEYPEAVAVMLSQSQSLSAPDLARLKAIVGGVLDTKAPNLNFAVWSFGTKLHLISPFGTASETTRLAIESVKNDGQTVELLHGITDVAKELAAQPASRRVLVLAANEQSDDTAYDLQEVINNLKTNGIRVIVVFPKRGDDKLTDAQMLRRLSEETSGQFYQSFDTQTAQQATAMISSYLSDSGIVQVPLDSDQRTLSLGLSSSKTLTVDLPVVAPIQTATTNPKITASPENVIQTATPNPKATTSPENVIQTATPNPKATTSPESTIFSFVSDRWQQASLLLRAGIGIAAAVFLLLLGFAVSKIVRLSKPKRLLEESALDAATTVGDLQPVYAWLVFLDSSETREPVSQAVFRIGRQVDNDLVLSNSSVHRHHAVLKRENSGQFSIMDMDTQNGVVVNEKRVSKSPLKDGDVVELGEVRMRFASA